ncbi:MAG: MBL fold metallo-hydrolase [Thermomicrobiales bacterium]
MLEVTSLGSGSSGNAFLIRTQQTSLLLDCGVGIRRVTGALAAGGLGIADIDAVLVSHEHSDHIRELPRFIAAGKRILCTAGSSAAARVPATLWQESKPGKPVNLANLEIIALSVDHDAVEPCGFLIRSGSGSITVVTDLGCPSPAAAEAIAESHLVVLEANHDVALLRRGPYPVHLQRRILSDSGHLSNDDCGALLATALKRSSLLPTVWLAHLSDTNNRPALARQTVSRRLAHDGIRLDVQPLPRRDIGPTWRPGEGKPGIAQLSLGFAAPDLFP